MKLKRIPEDFVVTERNRKQCDGGRFALYELSKTSIGTHEAISQISRNWNLTPHQVAHAGLKDRHAVTSQLITIRNGPQGDCESKLWSLTYLGQTCDEMTAADIESNSFEITVRGLSAVQASAAIDHLQSISSVGYPNYFDSQRFGSLTCTGRYAAERWCKRDFATALWLILAEYNAHDDAEERRSKQILRDHWGDWKTAKALLPKSHRRSVVTYLCDHPTKFRKAFALVNSDLRGLVLSAFQSAVWNRMLKLAILECSEAANLEAEKSTIEIGDCELPISHCEIKDIPTELSLPSGRKRTMDATSERLAAKALGEFKMQLSDMKLSFPRDRWFSKGQRASWIRPQELKFEKDVDDLQPGRSLIRMAFDLPRGCYATMLIKASIPELETN